MGDLLSRAWWAVLIRGVAAVFFGILALSWPGLTLVLLITLFGVYALVEGVATVFASLRMRAKESPWVWLLIQGLASTLLAFVVFLWPGLTAVLLLFLIAAWAMVNGICDVLASFRLRKQIEGEWVLAVTGILSLLLGIVLLARPGAGALALIWVIGIYALVFGILRLALAVRIRSLQVATRESMSKIG